MSNSLQFFRDVLAKNPEFSSVHHNLGNLLLQKGEIDSAIYHFQAALQIKSNYAEVYNSLGAAMAYKGYTNRAIAYFKEALKINPDFSIAKRNLDKLSKDAAHDAKINLGF